MHIAGKDMPTLFPVTADEGFLGFGPSRFRTACTQPTLRQHRSRSHAALLKFVKVQAPRSPGVYAMLGAKKQIIYVGKAVNLRARLLSYFRENSRDPKAGRILQQTGTLVWEEAADEFAALLRELELIRRYRPRFNVLGQPGRRVHTYLCLGRGPACTVHFSREPNGKEIAAYGPFTGRGRSEEAIRKLNHYFGLRDCPTTTRMHFADTGRLFDDEPAPKCLRHELGTCLAPCAGRCTTGEYSIATRAAKAFLDGRSQEPIATTTAAMEEASRELRFERAALLRDKLSLFEWLDDKLRFLRTARARNSFVYALTGADGTPRWYVIHSAEVQAVVHPPTDAESAGRIAKQLETIRANPLAATRPLERCVDSVLIVTSWFRKRAAEKANLLTMRQAENICRTLLTTSSGDHARGSGIVLPHGTN